MYKYIFFISLLLGSFVNAQRINNTELKHLQQSEDTLVPFAKQMIFDSSTNKRFRADSIFTKTFVRALKTPFSFYYPFDSVITVSIKYAPDSSFRIFTWQISRDEAYYRHHGAIQMNTVDGTLKLFPLIDQSDFAPKPTDTVRDNFHWIGALYYGMIMKEYKAKKYYTLLGFDDNDFISTKKWIDVLTFDDNGKPQFGGKFFDYKDDSIKPAQPAYRFCMEYKKDARPRMVYDPELDMIIFEHLISESNEPIKKFTLIPDGDYEGFKWANGKWVHVEKVFTQKLSDGQFPMPEPLLDDNGNADEKKLLEQSEKNKNKPKPPQ